MMFRALAVGAAAALLAGPALADCGDEIARLDESVVAAETGAATTESGMAATEHQEEVLSDKQAVEESDLPATKHQEQVLSDEPGTEATGSPGTVDATTQHQREATAELDDDDVAIQAGMLIDEARELEETGDEAACMAKVAEAKQVLGVSD